MNRNQIELSRLAAKPGMFIVYNDGRPGHTNAVAEILSRDDRGMVVQFDDRADVDRINFADDGWMKHISFCITREVARIADMFGTTPERVRMQFSKNGKQLARMAKQAKTRKVNGYTRQELLKMANEAFEKSKTV